MNRITRRTDTEAGAKLTLEGPLVTMAIRPTVKRGIVINLPSPEGVVSFTMLDNNGEWCGEGKIRVEHYSEASMQFLRGLLDHNCPPTSPDASGVGRQSSRRRRL